MLEFSIWIPVVREIIYWNDDITFAAVVRQRRFNARSGSLQGFDEDEFVCMRNYHEIRLGIKYQWILSGGLS